jgi:hypothetical protein
VTTSDLPTAEQRARRRAKYLTGVLWHVGAFVIINAFFWILDLTVGQSGLQWAYWITAVWGFGLVFHLLAYYIDGRGVEQGKYQKYLAEEQEREAGTP